MDPTPRHDYHSASEVQSSVTLAHFFRIWARYRTLFFIGLLTVGVVTFAWNKLVRTKYYQAETTFYVGSQFTANSRVGIAESKMYEGNRSDKYLVLQILQCERWLYSRELLLEAADRLKNAPISTDPETKTYDLYNMLGMNRDEFAEYLKENLVRVIQVQNSGVIIFRVEMPDPVAAARYANICIEVLQERFKRDDFRYLDAAAKVYEEGVNEQMREREKVAQQLTSMGLKGLYDNVPEIASRRSALADQLKYQGESLAQLLVQVGLFKLATRPEAKEAAQPVSVIERAYPPLKHSRPKTLLSTLMAMAVFTFVFLLGLEVVGFMATLGPARDPRSDT
jgi:uncharacterized protein involved in exopolysaccharide biosynthesis